MESLLQRYPEILKVRERLGFPSTFNHINDVIRCVSNKPFVRVSTLPQAVTVETGTWIYMVSFDGPDTINIVTYRQSELDLPPLVVVWGVALKNIVTAWPAKRAPLARAWVLYALGLQSERPT
jgi:hypothetical protein